MSEKLRQGISMAQESDRFVRWQKIAIGQLSYALNLVFTLTIATLGCWFVLLKDQEFTPRSTDRCTMLLSLSTLAFSAMCGFGCILNRLRDFRGTAQRARSSPDAPAQDEMRGLGTTTWGLFYAQVFSFAVGVAAIAITLLLTYGGKLR
jgi:4-hydroxybenzoate polyprenyltransferase